MSPTVLQQKRHQQILTDVVRAYIETGEPVSSRSVAHRHVEALSSATVRNVMADLEGEGYLYQPHTSAGRVRLRLPTAFSSSRSRRRPPRAPKIASGFAANLRPRRRPKL
jgi:hypothetical protein